MVASVFSPKGFKPSMRADGAAFTGGYNPYRIVTNLGTVIAQGDMVKLLATGTIAACAAGDVPVGIFQGIQYTKSNGVIVKSNFWNGSDTLLSFSSVEAYVVDDPNILYEGQIGNSASTAVGPENSGTTHAQTDVGQMYDIAVGAGSFAFTSLNGLSVQYADFNSGATSTKACRLVRYVDRVDNDPLAANPRALFAFGAHAFRVNTGI